MIYLVHFINNLTRKYSLTMSFTTSIFIYLSVLELNFWIEQNLP